MRMSNWACRNYTECTTASCITYRPDPADVRDLENSERNIWPPMCMLLGRDRNGKYLEIEIGTASDGISRPRHLLACLVGFP